jgi:hypothetical protein
VWLIGEKDDALTITGIPEIRWAAAAFCLTLGASIISSNLGTLASLKYGEKPFLSLEIVAAIFFVPAFGLVILFFTPLVRTTINKKDRTILQRRFGISGIYGRRFAFHDLDGGVRVSDDYLSEDEMTWYRPYIKLKSGERINLAAEDSIWRRRSYDVGMRSNEYLQSKQVLASQDDVITLGLT